MTTVRSLMTWRTAAQPAVWPLLFHVGESLESINQALEVVTFEKEPINWKENEIKALVTQASDQLSTLQKNNPLHKIYLLTFGMQSGVNLQFTLMRKDRAVTLASTLIIFKQPHITGADAFRIETITRVFEEIIRVTGSNLATLSNPPTIQEEWYYEASRKIDVYRAPITVEWMTFFGSELSKQIGRIKFEDVPVGLCRPFQDGFILKLQSEPFSYDKPKDRERQKRLHSYLNLDRMHKLYRN